MQSRIFLGAPVFTLVSGLLIAVAGCGDDEASSSKKGGGGGDGGSTSSGPATPLYGAPGVIITEVAIYQGVKRPLMAGGVPASSNVPLVPGRDALIRVFYSTDPNYDGSAVTGQLLIEGQETMEVVQQLLPMSASADATLESTVNFLIPGSLITDAGITYQVKLLQPTPPAENNPLATYPAESYEAVPASGPANTLRITMAPLQYNADGSGRVPDLGPEGLEQYRQRFLQWYPVSNVEMTVRPPLPWGQPIGPFGEGWQSVGEAVFAMRFSDGAPADVYYYGIFNPTSTLGQFCGGGCLLGVTLLNEGPPPGDPQLRFALGVGFPEVGRETATHEIGHAHGRRHVNCGPGIDPQSIDTSYPHNPQTTGVWGWDLVNNQMKSPNTHTDFMSYCENNWVSDHTYNALHVRGAAVNLPKILAGTGASPAEADHAEKVPFEIVSVGGDGTARWLDSPARAMAFQGDPITVTTFTKEGHPRQVRGHFRRWTHLPGGWLFVEKTDLESARAEFVIDGQFTVASR